MKEIKFIRPKQSITEHTCCDKCGLKPTFRSKDFSLFICASCANRLKLDANDLVDLPDNHISQLVPERVYRPYRPRKSDKKYREKLQKLDQSLRAKLTSCEHAEKKQIDAAQRSSASLLKANKRMLRKCFDTPELSKSIPD